MAIKYAVVDEPRGKAWKQFLDIFQEAFKSPEADSEQLLMDRIKTKRYHCVLAKDGRDVVAGALTSYLPSVGAGYIGWTCVKKGLRGSGIGGGLVAEIHRDLSARAAADGKALRGVFAEVHHGRTAEDKARVRFWRREGYKVLDLTWETPSREPLRMMLRSEREWTPLDLVPAFHAIFDAGMRHYEDYDTRLRTVLRWLLKKPLEKPVARS